MSFVQRCIRCGPTNIDSAWRLHERRRRLTKKPWIHVHPCQGTFLFAIFILFPERNCSFVLCAHSTEANNFINEKSLESLFLYVFSRIPPPLLVSATCRLIVPFSRPAHPASVPNPYLAEFCLEREKMKIPGEVNFGKIQRTNSQPQQNSPKVNWDTSPKAGRPFWRSAEAVRMLRRKSIDFSFISFPTSALFPLLIFS